MDAPSQPESNLKMLVDLTSAAAQNGAEARYRTIIEQAVEGVFRTTPEGRLVLANQALARILGYESPEQLIAERSDLERGHYVVPGERARFRRLIDTHTIVSGFEYQAYRRDHTMIWLRVHARTVRAPDGRVYYEGTAEDVTDRRRSEEIRQHLLARAISAQEEERARVARELHDETGQALSAILVGLRSIEEAGTIEQVRLLTNRLRDLTAQTIRDVGRIARGLRPSTLDDLGLVPALQRYSDELSEARGVAISINGTNAGRLPPEIETTLYRIVQEALTNVARHAEAGSAAVAIERRDGVVRATIKDDGRGFDVAAALQQDGTSRALGLVGMRERASLLGGKVEIASRPSGGSRISVELPIEHER